MSFDERRFPFFPPIMYLSYKLRPRVRSRDEANEFENEKKTIQIFTFLETSETNFNIINILITEYCYKKIIYTSRNTLV